MVNKTKQKPHYHEHEALEIKIRTCTIFDLLKIPISQMISNDRSFKFDY